MGLPTLDQSQIEAVANILGSTQDGLSGSQIQSLLKICQITDVAPSESKRKRLYNAFLNAYQQTNSTNIIWRFLHECFKPARGIFDTSSYDDRMNCINMVISLLGVEIRNDGQFHKVAKANNVSEAKQRASSLKQKLLNCRAHHDVIKCCTEELLAQDYFHAVHEAAKSLCDKVRQLSGLNKDGSNLFEEALCIKQPYIVLSKLATSSEQNEQKGLCNILCGINSMVRNFTAHELRSKWSVCEEEAVDILLVISFLHKNLDQCIKVPKVN